MWCKGDMVDRIGCNKIVYINFVEYMYSHKVYNANGTGRLLIRTAIFYWSNIGLIMYCGRWNILCLAAALIGFGLQPFGKMVSLAK